MASSHNEGRFFRSKAKLYVIKQKNVKIKVVCIGEEITRTKVTTPKDLSRFPVAVNIVSSAKKKTKLDRTALPTAAQTHFGTLTTLGVQIVLLRDGTMYLQVGTAQLPRTKSTHSLPSQSNISY